MNIEDWFKETEKNCPTELKRFDSICAENGVLKYKWTKFINSFSEKIDFIEYQIKPFINFSFGFKTENLKLDEWPIKEINKADTYAYDVNRIIRNLETIERWKFEIQPIYGIKNKFEGYVWIAKSFDKTLKCDFNNFELCTLYDVYCDIILSIIYYEIEQWKMKSEKKD